MHDLKQMEVNDAHIILVRQTCQRTADISNTVDQLCHAYSFYNRQQNVIEGVLQKLLLPYPASRFAANLKTFITF